MRLPKLVETHPHAERVQRALTQKREALWSNSAVRIPTVAVTPALAAALKEAASAGQLVRGLESAERTLEAEDRGQRMADAASGAPRGVRVSRLLLVTNDGADRFYRGVEALLRKHGARVLALRLELSAEALGALVLGPGERARLLLLEHKDAVTAALLALAAE